MSELAALGLPVERTDQVAETEVRERLETRWPLGRLADLAGWAAAVGAGADGFAKPHAVVFGAAPSDATLALGVAAGVGVHAAGELPADVVDAIAAGVALADARVDSGADLLIATGTGSETGAAVAVSVLTNTEPVKVVARGVAATDPDAWMTHVVEVRDRRRSCLALRGDPQALLVAIDSPALAALAAFVLHAAARRTPVVLDGLLASAAATVAFEAEARAVRWWCVADLGPDPAEAIAHTRLGQQSILALGTGLGDATAGVLAVQVLQTAIQAAR